MFLYVFYVYPIIKVFHLQAIQLQLPEISHLHFMWSVWPTDGGR